MNTTKRQMLLQLYIYIILSLQFLLKVYLNKNTLTNRIRRIVNHRGETYCNLEIKTYTPLQLIIITQSVYLTYYSNDL